jgi:hypothetical protein
MGILKKETRSPSLNVGDIDESSSLHGLAMYCKQFLKFCEKINPGFAMVNFEVVGLAPHPKTETICSDFYSVGAL